MRSDLAFLLALAALIAALASIQLLPGLDHLRLVLLGLLGLAGLIGGAWAARRASPPRGGRWLALAGFALFWLVAGGWSALSVGFCAPRVVEIDETGREYGPEYPAVPKVLLSENCGFAHDSREQYFRALRFGVILGRRFPYQG